MESSLLGGAAATLGRTTPADPRLDVRPAERLCDRDALAAVNDVVAVGALQQLDRRQRDALAVGERDAFPSGPDELRCGTEARVEVPGWFERSDDSRERDDLESCRSLRRGGGVRERQGAVAVPAPKDPAADPSQSVGAAPRAEVGLCVEERHAGRVAGHAATASAAW